MKITYAFCTYNRSARLPALVAVRELVELVALAEVADGEMADLGERRDLVRLDGERTVEVDRRAGEPARGHAAEP